VRVLLDRQVQLRIGGIEVLRAARAVRQAADLDTAEDAQELPLVCALDVCTTYPIATHHPINPRLQDRSQIEVILQQRADQLATIF